MFANIDSMGEGGSHYVAEQGQQRPIWQKWPFLGQKGGKQAKRAKIARKNIFHGLWRHVKRELGVKNHLEGIAQFLV